MERKVLHERRGGVPVDVDGSKVFNSKVASVEFFGELITVVDKKVATVLYREEARMRGEQGKETCVIDAWVSIEQLEQLDGKTSKSKRRKN